MLSGPFSVFIFHGLTLDLGKAVSESAAPEHYHKL